MNTVLADYSTISDLEMNKRISFYENTDFFQETVTIMIPDVCQYVRKIFYNMRLASQCRQIIEDIRRQIVDTRNSRKQFMTSVGYPVGSLEIDGRAFAQQNIRWWCQQVAGTIDSLCQVLNIVFCLGKNPWDRDMVRVMPGLLKKINGVESIRQFYEDYSALIKPYKDFDNFDKHNLIMWGHEKVTPCVSKEVEYYLKMEDIEYVSSDLISEEREREIKVALIELLDHIFELAKIDYHPNRKYVHISVDSIEIRDEVFNEAILPNDRLLQVSLKTKMREGERINESISISIDQSENRPLYLIQINSIDFPTFRGNSLSLLDSNVIEVLKGENHIGQYCCSNNKDRKAAYLHFKKYEFIPPGS